MMDLEKLYETNEQFRDYVDRYAKYRGISTEEALKHAIVRQYAEIESLERSRNPPGNKARRVPFRKMQEFEFLEYEPSEDERTPEDIREYESWKKKKKEAKARFTAMQNLP